MTAEQLHSAQLAIGSTYEIPKRDKVRRQLSSFIGELRRLRSGPQPLSERSRQAYVRTYKEEPPDEAKILDGVRRWTDRLEREIWDAQAKAGCKLRDDELVARDAEREGKPHTAARLRRKAVIR